MRGGYSIKYKIKDGFILRDILGEKTIIPSDPDSDITNGMLMPNETAAFIWECFQNPGTVDEAVERILDEYEVEEAVARAAVEQFVNEALHYRIIEEVNGR